MEGTRIYLYFVQCWCSCRPSSSDLTRRHCTKIAARRVNSGRRQCERTALQGPRRAAIPLERAGEPLRTDILQGALTRQPAQICLILNTTKLKLQFQVFEGKDLRDGRGKGGLLLSGAIKPHFCPLSEPALLFPLTTLRSLWGSCPQNTSSL